MWCAPVARVFFNRFLRFFSFFSFFCGWLDWRELRAFISSPLWDSRKNEDVPHEVEFSEEEHVDIQRPVIKSAQQEQRAAVHRGHTHAVCCSCLASSVDKGLSPGCCFETSYCRQRRGRGGEGLGALLTTAGAHEGNQKSNGAGMQQQCSCHCCVSFLPSGACCFLVLRSALLLPLPGLFLLQRCQAQLGRGS